MPVFRIKNLKTPQPGNLLIQIDKIEFHYLLLLLGGLGLDAKHIPEMPGEITVHDRKNEGNANRDEKIPSSLPGIFQNFFIKHVEQ